MSKKNSSPYEARVVSRQKYPKSTTSQISPQFNQFYEQNTPGSSKRDSLIHPSLKYNREQLHFNGNFDRFILSTTEQEVRRQGGNQERDSRQRVNTTDRYPYNCYGKVKATYQKQIPINHKPMVVNHKIKQDKQYLEFYSYGIAAFIGQGLMVTAAHVIPNQIEGKRLVRIEVYFQYSNFRLQVERVLTHPQYQFERQNSVSPFDMAILVMKPISNFKYPERYLSIQWDYHPQNYADKELKFLTFSRRTQQNLQLRQANHSEIYLRDQCMILYKNTTIGGDSGSAILFWKRESNQFKIVGLHIGDYGKANYGLLLTSKVHSPKDIFSQMIEYNLSLQQNLLIENNLSSLNRTGRQNKQEPSAIKIMDKLTVNNNYSLSTEKYIQLLEQENLKQQTQNQLLRQIVADLRNKNKNKNNQRTNLKNSYSTQILNKAQTKIQRNLISKQDNNKIPKKNKHKNNQQPKKGDNIITPRRQSFQYNGKQPKQASIEMRINKSKKKKPNQQQNCLVAICRVVSNWFSSHRGVIANEEQPSSSILQN